MLRAGTILVEAALSGRRLFAAGFDVEPAAVVAAAANGAGTGIGWAVADAGRLPVPDGSVDVVVSNPPWDRQVPPSGILARRPQRFWRELRRVLCPGGLAVLLLPDVDERLAAAKAAGFALRDRWPVSVAGRHPEIVRLDAGS